MTEIISKLITPLALLALILWHPPTIKDTS